MTQLPFPELCDEAIVLRPWQGDDVDQMLAAFSDPLFQEHSDWAPTTTSDARQALADQEEARQQGTKLDSAIVDPDAPTLVLGGVSLNWVNLSRLGPRWATGWRRRLGAAEWPAERFGCWSVGRSTCSVCSVLS